jgi:anti-sigma regulatory factor (Ser/Thr protein kinase)
LGGFTIGGTAFDWSHQASFDASSVCASQARNFVTQHLIDHRLLYLVDPVRLVASEFATNALVHAHTTFSVTLAASDPTVLLTVRDDSRALPAQRAHLVMDSSGRGLEIVDIISLDWGVNEEGDGSKAVWASFAMREPREF